MDSCHRFCGFWMLPGPEWQREAYPPEPHWPKSWRKSYDYDLQEIYGEVSNHGYSYGYDDRRHTIRLLTEALAPDARILDIRAAQGNFSLQLAEMGFEVTWNDLRGELARYVQLRHERGTLHFGAGNASSCSFRSLSMPCSSPRSLSRCRTPTSS